MNNIEKELLVTMLASGRNTYRDLRMAFPDVPERTWRIMGRLGNPAHDLVVCMREPHPYDDERPLQDYEQFQLTEYGQNLLLLISKERYAVSLSKESLSEARKANDLSMKANDLSRESNNIARDSHKEAVQSKRIAIAAFIVSLASIALAAYQHIAQMQIPTP